MARAKSLLERAAATGHLPAVYLLVDLLDREGATVRAIELLQRQLEGTSTATLHQLLADLLAKGGQEERAIQHYTQALALDPKNEVRMMNELLGEPTGMVTMGEQHVLQGFQFDQLMGKTVQQHAFVKDFSHFAFKQNPTFCG